MGEAPNQPYGRDEVNYATNVGAFLGWLIYSVYSLSGLDSIVLAFFWLLLFAVVGLPIAFLASWLIARPILLLMMRKPVSRAKAAFGGAGIAAIIAAISILIGRLNGYRISQDPTFNFWTGREIDGILTPFGWKMLALDSTFFIATGAAVGVLVRHIVGPGRTPN
ncbi:MAG: hypothetical protein NTW20_09545 [Rhodobacterales bacterium]|nr:hypothetical protein [Rhodobacterales bacterium]